MAQQKIHLIEVAFEDIGERNRAFDAIKKLLGEIGKIGILSARTEWMWVPDEVTKTQPEVA